MKFKDFASLAKEVMAQQPKTVTEIVTEALRSAIFEGLLKAGQMLSMEEIAGNFNISRMPVREALRKLESEGLVTIVPHKGVIVSDFSSKELEEIIEIRVSLEKSALKLALKHMSAEDYNSMEKILKKIEKENDPNQLFDLNIEFFNTLFLKSQYNELNRLISQYRGRFNRYLRLYNSVIFDVDNFYHHYSKIFQACREGNEQKALDLLEHHIRKLGNQIIDCIKYIKEE